MAKAFAIPDLFRERKLNTNFFFSNFSGAAGISRQNPGISRQKSLISLVSRHISNFLAPTRSRGRPLPHWKISGPKSLGLGSFFFPDLFKPCNLCGQLQRCQMPDIENSRKGCRLGHGKTAETQPEKHPKHPKNSQNSCFSGVSGVSPAVFRLFYRDPLGTLFGCFSAVFNVGHLALL